MRLYDTAELAALLGLEQGTLRTYRHRGPPAWLAEMPDQLYTVGGKPTWTWDADAIDAWLPAQPCI